MEKRWRNDGETREKRRKRKKIHKRTYAHLEKSIPTEMQYLFTCVNTSVPGWPAVKFEKCIAPGNSRNARPVSRLSDLACAWISASFLISRNRCASGSPLRPIESQTLISCSNDYSTPLLSRLSFSVFVKEQVKNDNCRACLRTRSLEAEKPSLALVRDAMEKLRPFAREVTQKWPFLKRRPVWKIRDLVTFYHSPGILATADLLARHFQHRRAADHGERDTRFKLFVLLLKFLVLVAVAVRKLIYLRRKTSCVFSR